MLTLQVTPRRGVPLRALLATVEILTAVVAAHTWAGGRLPSPLWIAAVGVLVFGAGLLVLRGRLPLAVVVPAVTVLQLLMHGWLVALAPSGGAGHAHGSHLELGWPMLLAHVAGALVTVLVWELRRRAVDVLLSWSRPGLVVVAGAIRVSPQPATRPTPSVWLVAAPRRGPPLALART